jgi:DNA uptake protein ComE-like DNA-binding protein
MNFPDIQKAAVRRRFGVGCAALALTLTFAGLGCNNPPKSDQELKDQAAQTTQEVKQDARVAAADAKVAAAKAERKVDDIAAGVKEGLRNDAPAPNHRENVDINSASEDQLTGLPGITPARARKIIGNRPFGSPHDLVSKGVVSEAEYQRISGRIVAD